MAQHGRHMNILFHVLRQLNAYFSVNYAAAAADTGVCRGTDTIETTLCACITYHGPQSGRCLLCTAHDTIARYRSHS